MPVPSRSSVFNELVALGVGRERAGRLADLAVRQGRASPAGGQGAGVAVVPPSVPSPSLNPAGAERNPATAKGLNLRAADSLTMHDHMKGLTLMGLMKDHAGKCVALVDGEVVASAEMLDDIWGRMNARYGMGNWLHVNVPKVGMAYAVSARVV